MFTHCKEENLFGSIWLTQCKGVIIMFNDAEEHLFCIIKYSGVPLPAVDFKQ